MNNNEQLIQAFYTCFKNKDYKGMQVLYDDKATFFDPVFGELNAKETNVMWEMLCKSAKDFELTFSDVRATEKSGSCSWIADYTFSKTGRKVQNHVSTTMEFENGKITKHVDIFNLWKWSSMAMGPIGMLLGWSSFLKNKIAGSAKKNLISFMSKS